jgi:NADPH:quinone reductase-like Zn-dependent oxidoreductase
MSIPRTYKAFRRSTGDLPTTIEVVTEELPSSLHPQEVLIRIHAVSLNYRDVAMLHGLYPVAAKERGIPASDCAAEVIAIGSEVKDFALGDRVAPIFDLNSLTGTEEKTATLGGDVDGVLRQFAVFDQKVLVHLPKHLSWEEVCICFNPFRFEYVLIVHRFLTGSMHHMCWNNRMDRSKHARVRWHW